MVEEAKKPEQATLSAAEPEKGKYQRAEKAPPAEEPDARKLQMGKGLVPEKKDDEENVKLKPIDKQVRKTIPIILIIFNYQILNYFFLTLRIINNFYLIFFILLQSVDKVELKPSEAKVINLTYYYNILIRFNICE